jgi:hypothetical protein
MRSVRNSSNQKDLNKVELEDEDLPPGAEEVWQ